MTDQPAITLKCTVRDGRFVEPCTSLERQTDTPAAGFSRARGTARWHYTNLRTHQPSRTFFGVKTKESPNGMLFNFCPWCGEKIDAPFAEADADAGDEDGEE